METTYAEITSTGPVRAKNEDCIAFWQPDSPDEKRAFGIVAMMADGVGGESRGDLASRLAVDTAMKQFREAKPETPPSQLLRQIFNAASLAVYDLSMHQREEGTMSTTLNVSIFRNNEVTVGHIGDTRVYHVRRGEIKRVTTDHSYVDMQIKLGLISERDAMSSRMRSVLTRSIGRDPICRFDQSRQELIKGDFVVQCTDGLYAFILDHEICDVVWRLPPAEACQRLVAMAEKRGSDDNISIQIVQVHQVERISFYRGAPIYHKVKDVPLSDDVEPGQILDERFEITDCISRSGMATIFKANDLKTNRTVALKVPLMQFESDIASHDRFTREEEIGKSLNHPFILKIIPIETQKSRPYIVMEYLEGQTLDRLMRAVGGALPLADGVKIASRICEALDYLHQNGVVHRDLKPQNIMICDDGSIRIMDFGIAKKSEARRITFVGFSPSMGTPEYMAPEQVRGKRGDERTDIYSLGAILYEMSSGSIPFQGENPYVIMNARLTGDPIAPRKVNPKISPVLEEIILHAMERDPDKRYPSALAMKAELDDPEKVVLIGRFRHLQPPQLWKARLPMAKMILIFVAVQVIVFLILVWFFRNKSGH